MTQELGSRDILVPPSGQTHAIIWKRPAGIVTLYLSDDFLFETVERPQMEFADSLTLRDSFVTTAASELAYALAADGAANSLYAEALVTAITYRTASSAEAWSLRRSENIPAFTTG